MADWYFGSYPRCGFEKYLVKIKKRLATKLQLSDTIEKALLLVIKDLRILSNSLSLRLKFRATSPFSVSSESGLIYETTPLFANS